MDNCDDFLELISAKLDGALTPAEEQTLAEHLAECGPCRALLDDFTQMHTVLADLGQSAPPHLAEGVLARIQAESAPIAFPAATPKKSRRWRSWGAMAAVFALVLAGTVTLRLAGWPVDAPAPAVTATASGDPLPTPRQAEAPQVTAATPRAAEVPQAVHAPQATAAPQSAPRPAPAATAAAVPNNRSLAATPAPTASGAEETDDSSSPLYSTAQLDAAAAPTPASACLHLFEFLRDQNYPDLGATAPWEGAELRADGTQVEYVLAPTVLEGETYTFRLVYVGLSQNHKYYEFHYYADVTGGAAPYLSQAGWYAVSRADGSILTQQDDPAAYLAAVGP